MTMPIPGAGRGMVRTPRARGLGTLGILLSALFLSGCVNLASHFDKADLDAPMGNIQGPWWSPYDLLEFQQVGDQVTGKATGPGGPGCTCKGKMTGRVFQGQRNDSFEMAFVVSQDGRTATFMMTDGITMIELKYFRGLLGPSSTCPALSKSPELSGGYICQAPVTPEGMPQPFPGGKAQIKEVFAVLQYFRNQKGVMKPWVTYVPLQPPRIAVSYQLLAEGLGAAVLDAQRGQIQFLSGIRKSSPFSQKRPATIDGRPCWWVFTPLWDYKSQDLTPNHILGECFYEDPDQGGPPAESVWVSTRTDQTSWRADSWYFIDAPHVTSFRGILENGQVVRVEGGGVEAPPLDHFLVVKETFIWEARWRNRALLQVKLKTIPQMLTASKTKELSDLIARLEQVCLDLSHESDLARDQVQKNVEKAGLRAHEIQENRREAAQLQIQLQDPNLEEGPRGALQARLGHLQASSASLEQQGMASEQEVDQLREMSTVYRERVEILKPMLAAIKEEISNRGK